MDPFYSRVRQVLRRLTVATWKFFFGVVVAVVGLAANFADLKQPDLSVEITAVTTGTSDPIDVVRVPELAKVKDFLGLNNRAMAFFNSSSNPGYSPDDVSRQIAINTDRILGEAARLDKVEKQMNSILSDQKPDEESQLIDLDGQLEPVGDNPEQFFFGENGKNLTPQDRVGAIVKKLKKALDGRKKSQEELASKATNAAQEWSSYKEKILPNKARLVVTAAIGNRGSGSTSLKPQGLLRANLGDGNYLDLNMRLSGYESATDLGVLPARAFKVVRFQSDEVESMNPADRQRYNTFLGNVSPATLYAVDVHGNKYASNSVPFSPGVYEQKVYDSLKAYATRLPSRR